MKITKNNVKNKNIFLIMLTSDTPKKKKKLLPHKDFYKRKTFVRILIIYRILKIWKVCCYFYKLLLLKIHNFSRKTIRLAIFFNLNII